MDAGTHTLTMPSVLSEKEGNLRMRARYQQGSLKQIKRESGYLVWLFRWRETDPDGKRRPKKIVVGRVSELRTEADARRALQALRINVNMDLSEQARPPRKFADLVDHYRLKEVIPENNDRKSYSTKMAYKSYLTNWIIPQWGDYMLSRIKKGITVHVAECLITLTTTPA